MTLLSKNILVALMLVFSFSVWAQSQNCDNAVEGHLYDYSTGEPLPYGTVQVKGTQKGTTADENGYFKISNICNKEFDLIFSFIGYKEKTHHHDIYHKLPKIYLAPSSFTLESIVVEGESNHGDLESATVSSLSATELEQNKTGSLASLAGNISGVSVIKTGQNIMKPVIHGLFSNRVLIINNGVRHEFQNWGADHAPEIDPSLIESLEVIKGAATVRYGPDALGGVILINPPKMDLFQPLKVETGVTAQSNGRSLEGNVQLNQGFHRTAYMVQSSWLKQGDLSAPNYILTNSGKNEYSAAMGARYDLAKMDFDIYYSHFEQELGILRASVNGNFEDLINSMESIVPPDTKPFDYDINNPKQTVQHDFVKLGGKLNGHDQTLDFQYALQINKRQEYDLRRGTSPSIDLELFSQTLDIDWKHPQIGNWMGSIGLQGLYQDNNNIPGTNTVPFVPNYNVSRLGLYLIESRQISSKDWLEIGTRFDYQYNSIRGREPNNDVYRNEIIYKNGSATVGYRRKIDKNRSFRSNIGTAWRPPNISELYSYGRHQSRIYYGLWRFEYDTQNEIETNSILTEDDKESSSEMGFKWVNSYNWKTSKIDAEITGYINYISNYIYSRPGGITNTVRGAFPYFLFEQTDALFSGIDFSAHFKHNRNWISQFRANYLWAEDLKNDGYLVNIPPPNMAYDLHYSTKKIGPFTGIKSSLKLNYFFKQYRAPRVITAREILEAQENDVTLFAVNNSNFDLMAAPNGYFLIDLAISADYKSFSLLFKVNNLLNNSYRSYTDQLRYFADDMGINFSLGVKYKLQL